MEKKHFIFLVMISFLLSSSKFSFAEDTIKYKTNKINVIGSSANMHYHDKGIIFDSSGTVGSIGIPQEIKIGDLITVKDKTIRANHIFVTEYLKEMKWQGEIIAKKGQTSCVIVSDEDNLPYGEIDRDRLWIHVTECRVMNSEIKKPEYPNIVGNYKWTHMTPEQKRVYAVGVLEALAFNIYSIASKNNPRGIQIYNNFVDCVLQTKSKLPGDKVERGGDWSPSLGWLFGENLDKSAAWVIYNDISPLICKDFENKETKKEIQMLKIFDYPNWQKFSLKEKSLYVGAYVDVASALYMRKLEVGRSERARKDLTAIQICIEAIGIDGILSEVMEVDFHETWPLPWSVAKGFGKACRKYF